MSKTMNTNFTINAPKPIDSRMQVNLFADLDLIAVKYSRMAVFCLETDLEYRYYPGELIEWVAIDASNTQINWGDIVGDITQQTDLMNKFDEYALVGHTHPPEQPAEHTHLEVDILDLNKYSVEDADDRFSTIDTGLIAGGKIIPATLQNTFTIELGLGLITQWAPNIPSLPPVITEVEFGPFVGVSLPNINNSSVTYIGVTLDVDTAVVVQQRTPFTNEQRRSIIVLGSVLHANHIIIDDIIQEPNINIENSTQTHDIISAVGSLNVVGNRYTAIPNTLRLTKSEGIIFKRGVNFHTNPKDPHHQNVLAQAQVSLTYKTQSSTINVGLSNILPNSWDDGGLEAAVPNSRWTVQRVYLSTRGRTYVQLGQNHFATKEEAITDAMTGSFNEEIVCQDSIKILLIAVQQGAVYLSDSASAELIPVGKFGAVYRSPDSVDLLPGDSSGLERLEDINGSTWRLIGKDPTYFWPGGLNAIDFGDNTDDILKGGASGGTAFNIGQDNLASGYGSTTRGSYNVASNQFSRAYGISGEASGYSAITDGYFNEALGTFAFARGYRNIARGYGSYAQGLWNDVNSLRSAYAFGDSNKTIAENSFLSGIALDAGDSFGVAVFGTANEVFIGGGSADRYNENDPIFIVGNGTYSTPETDPWEAVIRSNALLLDKGGRMFLPSVTNAKIDAASSDVLVTRAWVEANGVGGGGSLEIKSEGVSVVNPATILNFTGSGVTVTDAGAKEATVNIESQVTYDEVYDTEAELIGLDPLFHPGKTYWAFDTKVAYRSINNPILAQWNWQKLTVEYDVITDTFKLPSTYLGQTQDLGQELFFLGVNNSAVPTTELEPKLFLGLGRDAVFTKRLSCSLAKASDIKNGDVYGVSTTAALAGMPMVVTTYGEVKDVKTNQWAVNSVLYASSVAGELTDVRPESNARIIAEVLVSHATGGVLSINTVQNLSLEKESSIYTSRVVHLTGEPDGANYFASETIGGVPTANSTVSVPNNAIVSLPIYHTGDSPQLVDRTIVKGERTATLSYAVDSLQGQEKFYIEAYLVDELGATVDAPTGLPVGSLGFVPIGVLESPLLNTLVVDQEATINLAGTVPVDTILPTNFTVRYQIRCEKVGATGGAKIFTLYFGFNHDSKIIGLTSITTDVVENTSGVTGATATEALNTLNSRFGGYVSLYTNQAIAGTKTFTENVSVAEVPTLDEHLTNKLYVDQKVAGATPTLQQVLDTGNSSSTGITLQNASQIQVLSDLIGATPNSVLNYNRLVIYSGGVGSAARGVFQDDRLTFSDAVSNILTIKKPDAQTGSFIQSLQDKAGTIALTSDIIPQTFLHENLTDISENQHHNKVHSHDGADGSGLVAYNNLTGIPAVFPPTIHTHDWSDITGTPTTIAGYGITDAYTKVEADDKYLLNTTDILTGDLTVTGVLSGFNLSGTNTGDNAVNNLYSELVSNVTTNLSEGTTTTTTVDVNSSDGTNATLLEASTTRAGLLGKAKFDEIVVNSAKVIPTNADFVDLTTAQSVSGIKTFTTGTGLVLKTTNPIFKFNSPAGGGIGGFDVGSDVTSNLGRLIYDLPANEWQINANQTTRVLTLSETLATISTGLKVNGATTVGNLSVEFFNPILTLKHTNLSDFVSGLDLKYSDNSTMANIRFEPSLGTTGAWRITSKSAIVADFAQEFITLNKPTTVVGSVTATSIVKSGGTGLNVLLDDGTTTLLSGIGGTSPLTTKGDVFTYSTVDARLGVGTNGQVLTADSVEATGLKWTTPTGDLLVENAATTGTYNLDYNYDTWLLTLTGAVTFTESNLPTSGTNTKVITIHVLEPNGNSLTFPANWGDHITGAFDSTPGVFNTIVVEFIKNGIYKVDISQPD